MAIGLLLLAWAALAQAQIPPIDYYIVLPNGDTVRQGIAKIHLWHDKHGRHQIRVKYEDGDKLFFTASDIKAFSFFIPHSSFFRWTSQRGVYHQMETLQFTDKETNLHPMWFYEKIYACNGHALYRTFVDDDLELGYFVSIGNVMKYSLSAKRYHLTNALETLMAECATEIEAILWPPKQKKAQRPVPPHKS